MTWLIRLFTSSIGQKLIMSLTGLFLITFLVVHLVGNLQLLYGDGGAAFNIYAEFMSGNPLIKFVSIGLYAGILLHAIQGLAIKLYNKKARGQGYAKTTSAPKVKWYANQMAILGIIILAFIIGHMAQFWFRVKFGSIPTTMIDGVEVGDLYTVVSTAFDQLWIVILYVISLIALAFHLLHGFGSAFQTLGLNHVKYTPIINGVGAAISILIPLGYAIIPVYMFLT